MYPVFVSEPAPRSQLHVPLSVYQVCQKDSQGQYHNLGELGQTTMGWDNTSKHYFISYAGCFSGQCRSVLGTGQGFRGGEEEEKRGEDLPDKTRGSPV